METMFLFFTVKREKEKNKKKPPITFFNKFCKKITHKALFFASTKTKKKEKPIWF